MRVSVFMYLLVRCFDVFMTWHDKLRQQERCVIDACSMPIFVRIGSHRSPRRSDARIDEPNERTSEHVEHGKPAAKERKQQAGREHTKVRFVGMYPE